VAKSEAHGQVSNLKIASLVRDAGTQCRAELCEATVAEYAALPAKDLPPCIVFRDIASHFLADGFHRVAAAEQRGDTSIACEVRDGTLRDAVLFALGANRAHGLRRTNADKRRAVEVMLADDEWRTWSDRRIAETCGVDDKTVASVRAQLRRFRTCDSPAERIGKDGKKYKAKKSKPPTPAAAPEPDDAQESDGDFSDFEEVYARPKLVWNLAEFLHAIHQFFDEWWQACPPDQYDMFLETVNDMRDSCVYRREQSNAVGR
jgi:hypothetical protein